MQVRRILAIGALVGLAGCSLWPQARSDSGRSGYNPSETAIGLAGLGSGGVVRNGFIGVVRPDEPIIAADGYAYVADAFGDVGAYDLGSCLPGRCRPVFSAPGSQPMLAHGMLLALGPFGDTIVGYDPHGVRKCGGTPTVCAPMYTAALVQFGNPSTRLDGFVVSGDLLLTTQDVDDEGEGRYVVAYDLNGVQGCRPDGNGGVFCDATWLRRFGLDGSSVELGRLAALGGTAFVRENDDGGQALTAVDSTGVLWTGAGDYTGNPVAAGGSVWVSRRTGQIDAFDARGRDGCSGAPRICTPRWTAVPPAPTNGYAVAGGRLYVGTTDGYLYVFDATGNQGCSGSPRICAPLWSARDDPGIAINEPTIANGVVYAVSAGGDVDALDSSGVTGCRGVPTVCQRVFNSRVGTAPAGSAVVGAGHLLVRTADAVVIYSVR